MTTPICVPVQGAFGNDKGANADGVLLGVLTPAALSALLLASHALPALCITDDGGLYVQDTADFADADADDVELLPAAPAVDDAIYFGHATSKFARLEIDIGTAGDWDGTVVWQYWNGAAWTNLADVVDGTAAFEAAAGVHAVTFTEPGDWQKNTVDNVLAYWVRANVDTFVSITTQPTATKGNIVAGTSGTAFADDTADANDADAGDVDLLPATPALNDAVYIGHASKFCKVKATISQERTGVATLVFEYWNGAAWVAVPTVDDDTAGWTAAPGTYFIHFVPPADWVANTAGNGPNGTAGFFVRMRVSVLTSVTQQPQATQLWVLPLTGAGAGLPVNFATNVTKVTGHAQVKSANNADSKFLIVNKTAGTFTEFTWTKTEPILTAATSLAIAANAEIAVVQITEDGTTEFSNGALFLAV